jgi:chromosome segregation ATPase
MNAQPTQLADYAARRTSAKRRAAAAAIRRIDQRAGQITFAAVAREAGVDRSWLYSQTDLAHQIAELRQQTSAPLKPRPRHERASTDSLRTRLAAAGETIDHLRAELAQQRAQNEALRDQIARLRGADWEPRA